MAILGICGFESGGNDSNYQCYDGIIYDALATDSGAVTISSAIKRTGGYSLLVNVSSSSNDNYLDIRKNAALGIPDDNFNVSNIYISFYLRVDTLPTTRQEIFYIHTSDPTNSSVLLAIKSNGAIEVRQSTSYTLQGTSTSLLSTGQWYRIDIKGINNGGTCELRIDRTSEVTWASHASTFTWLYVWVGVSRNQYTDSLKAYYDDIVIADDAYVGSAGNYQISRLRPNANGTDTAWTGDYTAVDEHPIAAATPDYSNTSTNTNKESYGLTAATGVIGASDTIKAAQASWIGATPSTSLTAMDLYVISGGTAYDRYTSVGALTNPSLSSTISYHNTIVSVMETNPNGGGAWTLSALDGLEIGIEHKQAQSREIQWHGGGVDVLYVPAAATGARLLRHPIRPFRHNLGR